MPITFTEEDFQVSPAQPKAGFFSERDFAPKPKRTPQQVMQEVAAAQASRDVVNPPETQGLIGKIAASPITGGIVNVASLRPVMTGIGNVASFIGNTIANDLNFTGEQQPKPFVIDTVNGTISQEPGVQQPFGAGRPMVQVPLADPQARMGIRDVSALPQVLGQLVEGLSTPENVATLPLAAGKSVGGQVAATLFAPQMISSGVESGMQALDSQLDPRAREEAAWNATINLLLGGKIGKGLLDARPWTPEVLPPLQRPVAPVGRQLQAPEQSFIDAEVVVPPRLPAPGERPTMPTGSPLDRPAGAARFGVDPTGKAVDISQLSPKEQIELYRGPKEFVPREQYVRPSQGPVPIVGEPKMMPNPLPNVDQPLVPFQNETRPLKREFVPSKLPVEPSGGEVSFRAPAQAQGIPSARQSALPQAEMPKREVVFQNETAPEAPAVPAKPVVAKLSTSGNKNPLGDPMGSTYYATPEDWSAWQKVQTDFKDLLSKGAEFDGPEMMKVRQENENIKNRYGGMPPVEPKSGGIGGGVKGAVDKNKEAGSVENPFARIVDKFKNKEKEKRGDTFALSGPRIALDPKESGFKDVTKKVDAQQLWNRVKNKLTPAERDIYEKNGVDKMIVGMGKVSPEEAAQMLQDNGVEVQTHSYGMEGKVSEAKREYDRMTHEWYDVLPSEHKDLVRWELSNNDVPFPKDHIKSKLKENGMTDDNVETALRFIELRRKVSNEKPSHSPRATSAYETVSPFPTSEPMPDWTTSKEGKNVQRVDVVIPTKGNSGMAVLNREGTGYRYEQKGELWQPDNLHENLPNTLGWAMIQYKDGPKGEKVAVVVEAQSRWGQAIREYKDASKRSGEPEGSIYDQYGKMAKDKNHPLLRDYNRLILKAAIDQARKEGATHIMVSDAETAMMTERHDAHTANEVRQGFLMRPEIAQEPGMRLNYDTILPKIMEELSGEKGERVSLGEHKNALTEGNRYVVRNVNNNNAAGTFATLAEAKDYVGNSASYKIVDEGPRKDLIFRNPDGTPKTDVSGTMYKIPQTDKKFSVFEKDRPESVAGRLYVNPIGPIVKQTTKDVATLGKKVKEVGTDFIRAYSEPLQEQMGRLGGPVGKMVSEEAGQIISRGKELYGELTPVIDPAKKQVGKMMRGGTTWMRGRNEVTPYASFNNFFGANEGAVQVPTNAKRGMKVADDANYAFGKMASRANPGFVPNRSLQRIITNAGYDFLVNGGEGWNHWIEGLAKLNNNPVAEVQNFFNKMKETLGDPSSDAASLDQINQDFTRKFPRTITHIKTATGWHEVVVSDPFNYLEQAAQRTAHSVAFREVYPLIEHNGQWVQSGKLQATRKAIMKELDKGSDIVKFDNLVKALQGHPLDTFKGGATTAIGAVSGTIGSPLKALMLSANAPVNIGEVLSGGPSIFMGYTTMGKAVAKMLTDNTFYDQLELTGARNKAMYSMALDPSSPLRSVARQVATGVRALTGQQFLNEIQEATAAASAKVYSDAIKGGQMSKYSLNRAKALFRAMGFNEGQASKMVKGDVELLKQFENRAAAWLTTGNQSTAEMSRLGASRLFNAAFWFHKYPQMTLNQFRSVGGNLIDDIKSYGKSPSKANWSPLYHNSVLMGRILGGRAFQGAITIGILAGVSGGIYGIYQTIREALEEPIKFIGDSMVSGFNGPLSVLQRLNQNVKGGESFTKELVKLSAPASINQDLIDMGMGVGRYAGMSKMESISAFLESKTPISRTIRMGLAVSGLAEKDLELEVAMKAFYKWRKEQPGFVPMGQMGGTDEQVEIRSGMQKVKKAIESGEDWVAELKKVKDTKGAGASLRAGTMLQLNGKPLDAEQMKSLEKRLGANGLEKIKLRDAMVREVGRELNEKKESGEKQAPEEIKKPTGKWAVDYETDSVRSQRVMGRLEPKVQEFLKQNGVEDVGYTPSLKRGSKRQQLTVEQAKVLEDELVVQLDKMVGTLAKNKNLESQTPKLRQTLISNMLEGARKIAMAKSLGKIPQDPEQLRR